MFRIDFFFLNNNSSCMCDIFTLIGDMENILY